MNTFEKFIGLENEAARFGFKWETSDQITAQIRSEIAEIEVHLKDGDTHKLQEEIGDLLHAAFSLCLFCQFDPKETLDNSVNKFERRFNMVKQLTSDSGLTTLNEKSFDDLMLLWEKAKKITG